MKSNYPCHYISRPSIFYFRQQKKRYSIMRMIFIFVSYVEWVLLKYYITLFIPLCRRPTQSLIARPSTLALSAPHTTLPLVVCMTCNHISAKHNDSVTNSHITNHYIRILRLIDDWGRLRTIEKKKFIIPERVFNGPILIWKSRHTKWHIHFLFPFRPADVKSVCRLVSIRT